MTVNAVLSMLWRSRVYVGFMISAFFLFSVVNVEGSSIVINELMSSNSNTLADEDGDFNDWIELYNSGDESIDLEGWGLSDNASNLFKWEFPKVIIKPGEHLLVWASGKDRRPASDPLPGGIKREVFFGIGGSSINDLLASPNYPNNPDEVNIVTDYFEAPVNFAYDYGQRMHALFKAPATGNYIFWISGDDNSHLYLSSDNSQHNTTLIASVPGWTNSREWGKYSEQKSSSQYLVEGNYYYLAAIMKQGGGGDNLAVRVQLPDGSMKEPIPASYFVVSDMELHTNFSIASDGEEVFLSHPEDGLVFTVPAISLPSDISIGLKSGEEGFFFFENPTPGTANNTAAYSEIINDLPEFSHTGGFYSEAFNLSISSERSDLTIYYTLDGSDPDPSNLGGRTYEYQNRYPAGPKLTREYKTLEYTEPLTIEDRTPLPYELGTINPEWGASTRLPNSNYFKGTVVRAILHKENTLSLRSVTNTYFISPEGADRYKLPVVSIVTAEPNLFDYIYGIYTAGKVGDDNPHGRDGGSPANYNQRGMEWERPGHFEYFPGGSQSSYKQNIGIRTHGGWSRSHYRKPLRLYARHAYDERNSFEYPFFGDLPSQGDPNIRVDEFRRLILRNSGNDFDGTLYRDALMQDLVKHLPFTTQAYQPVIHFINGEFWGLMNIRERYDQHYLSSHFNMEIDDIVILEAYASVNHGFPDDRNQFLDIVTYAENNNLNVNIHYNWVSERVDVESLAQYYAAQIYFYNTDWPGNNLKLWKKRTENYIPNSPYGHDGRWRWMLYDTDFGMNLYGSNQNQNDLPRILRSVNDPSSRLFRQLMKNTGFKNMFINITADQLNTCFKPELIHAKVNELNSIFAPYRDEHWNRWRSGTSTGSSIKTFATQRPANILTHTRNEFKISSTRQLSVNTEFEQGKIKVNSIVIDETTPGISNVDAPYPWTGVYFLGVPISLKAIPNKGYVFSHWQGVEESLASSDEIEINITVNTAVVAHFKKAPESQLIHYWHFNYLEDEVALPAFNSDFSTTADLAILSYEGSGDGYMDMVEEGSELNLQIEEPAGYGLRLRNPSDTRELILNLPSSGFQDLVLKYAVSRTNNGARNQNIHFRTEENGSWKPFASNVVVTSEYQLVTLDFSKSARVNNNPHFAVRITFSDEHAANTSGNNRFDNITLEGIPVITSYQPEHAPVDEVLISPNPANDEFSVISGKRISAVRIYSLNGSLIQSYICNSHSVSLTTGNLPKGVYLVETLSDKGRTINKLITN